MARIGPRDTKPEMVVRRLLHAIGRRFRLQAIRESTQQNVSRAGDQITSRNLQIQPTITIRPGAPVRLVVHRDLILARWKE